MKLFGRSDTWGRKIDAPRLVLAAATIAAGLFVAFSTLRIVMDDWQPLPILDQWDELVSGRHFLRSWLFSQHNEHRILVPRLVFIADRWLADETNRLGLAVNVITQAGLALLLFHLFRGAGVRGYLGRVWAGGLCLALLFWAIQYENFVWGFQISSFGVMLAATGAFTTLSLNAPSLWTVASVIALETLAVYTLASGILVPLLLTGLALLLGRPRWIVITLAMSALMLMVTYLWGYTSPIHSDPLNVPNHLATIVAYAVIELGGPIGSAFSALTAGKIGSRAMLAVAAGAGAFGAVVFACLAWQIVRSSRLLPPQQVVFLAVASFVIGACLITGVARWQLGFEQAMSSRYATPALVFWVSIIFLFAVQVVQVNPRAQASVLVMTLALPITMLAAMTEGFYDTVASRAVAGNRAAIPAALVGISDTELLTRSYPRPEVPLQRTPLLRAAGTSIFHDPWSAWLGTALSTHVRRIDSTVCEGSFNGARQVTFGTEPGWRAVGEAAYSGGGAAVRKVLLVDVLGLIVGYGIGGLDLQAINIPSPTVRHHGMGWIGAFKADSPRTVAAYGLITPGPVACPLGVARSAILLEVLSEHPSGMTPAGYVDVVAVNPENVQVNGCGLLPTQETDQMVLIDTNIRISASSSARNCRPDVAEATRNQRLLQSGFSATLSLAQGTTLPPHIRLCVWTESREFGRHILTNSHQPDFCRPTRNEARSCPPVLLCTRVTLADVLP
jgi:hypothetical protein